MKHNIKIIAFREIANLANRKENFLTKQFLIPKILFLMLIFFVESHLVSGKGSNISTA